MTQEAFLDVPPGTYQTTLGPVTVVPFEASITPATGAFGTVFTVSGNGPFTRQWKRNGENISGATNTTYTSVSGDVGVISCLCTPLGAQSVQEPMATVTGATGSIEYLGGSDWFSTATPNFGSFNFTAGRNALIGFFGFRNIGFDVTSLTVGANAGALVTDGVDTAQASNGGVLRASWYVANSPSGAANVTAAFSTLGDCRIEVYEMPSAWVVEDVVNFSADRAGPFSETFGINVGQGGAVLGSALHDNNAPLFGGLTGATQRARTPLTTIRSRLSFDAFGLNAETPRSITVASSETHTPAQRFVISMISVRP